MVYVSFGAFGLFDCRAGTVQDFHGSVRFRFSYPRFDFFRIGSVVFNTMKYQDLGLTTCLIRHKNIKISMQY